MDKQKVDLMGGQMVEIMAEWRVQIWVGKMVVHWAYLQVD